MSLLILFRSIAVAAGQSLPVGTAYEVDTAFALTPLIGVVPATRGLGGDDAPRKKRAIGRDRGFDEVATRKKYEADEALLEEIRALYRKLVHGEVPELAERAEEIVAPLVPEVVAPAFVAQIHGPSLAELRATRARLQAAALTLEKIKANAAAEIALRLAYQELQERQAAIARHRTEYVRRVQLLLEAA